MKFLISLIIISFATNLSAQPFIFGGEAALDCGGPCGDSGTNNQGGDVGGSVESGSETSGGGSSSSSENALPTMSITDVILKLKGYNTSCELGISDEIFNKLQNKMEITNKIPPQVYSKYMEQFDSFLASDPTKFCKEAKGVAFVLKQGFAGEGSSVISGGNALLGSGLPAGGLTGDGLANGGGLTGDTTTGGGTTGGGSTSGGAILSDFTIGGN